ncbi:polysaccharide biosynthesis tyrosine autokinase [Panacibacter ginsenosidivorans]|uniref:Polysaccharide biosynthesis tyrosine autokinase n=1 Tax=Panacibacter ginsenosidivorans TaxID=1813871 RepID=A0A5B8VG83_9BACT|nr:polysaccharide biosynthesis tyrosine autokinase [Panacibacter ginsenosidivorans]QEC69586.1 polysaccharide biosynthesis tyrosine autokinase [Panacibacter ginsenosidivorans]
MQSNNKPNDNTNAGIVGFNNGEEGFDFKYLVAKVAGNWKWFVLSLVLCVGLGVLYILYGIPTFTISARVLVNGANSSKINSGVTETNMLSDLALFSQQNDVNNEIQELYSRTLVEKAIRDLQLNVSYWALAGVRFAEVYKKSPFFIDLIELKGGLEDPLGWDVRIAGDRVKFMDDYTPDNFEAKWGDTIRKKYCTFVIKKNPESPEVKDSTFPLGLKINTYPATNYTYMENLLVFMTAANTTLMDVTFDVSVPQKGEDFVNYLIKLYVDTKVKANNSIADSTIRFIDDRITGVAKELSNVESQATSILTSGGITDINESNKQLTGEKSEASTALENYKAKTDAVDLIEKYLNDPARINSPLPTASNIDDPTYITQVQKYNTLQQQRETQLQFNTEKNPAIINIDNQIAITRGILKNVLATYRESLSFTAASLEKRNVDVIGRVSKAPVQQRQYLEASRRQDVLQQLYVYLLTVREQTAVTKSNNIAPVRVIDEAKAAVYPWWPNKIIVIIAAIFLGIVIPSCAILINELNSNKVITPADISASTTVPIIAEISASKSGKAIIVSKESRTAVAEQFRTLRTSLLSKLSYSSNGSSNLGKVIMLTSTVSGEGKSFVTLNLATALSLAGKKVLVVDLELRKSQLSRDLGIDDKEGGIADYLEKKASLHDVIVPSGVNENLWALLSGTLEANPSEALLNERMKTMFEDMRSKFDYIVVDTPPAAIVTDAQVIGVYADITLYVVRQKYTFKKHIDVIEDLKANNKLKNMYVILNDVKPVPGYNQGYGLGYRFDEDHGYYTEEEKTEKKSILQKIFPDADA